MQTVTVSNIILLYLLFFPLVGAGQSQSAIKGIVLDIDKNPIIGATVSLNNGNKRSTDIEGQFLFENITDRSYVLSIQAVGFQDTVLNVTVSETNAARDHTIILRSSTKTIDEIQVQGVTERREIKDQPIRAIVVDALAAREQPATLTELMNRSSGVRIRQSGGLGNAVDLSINGFQSNSVQYFRDGIPLEYLGGGYGLNNVPLNQLDRVEIYKGVVPVTLGGDALGGAVNLVTNDARRSYLHSSYELASFNTHIANLSFMKTDINNRYFGGVDAFYNYSKNNYQVDVSVVDENSNLLPVTVPLFHNSYKQYFVEGFAGIRNRKWVDELKLSIARYDIHRASQHPALMTAAYGQVMVYNEGWVPSLRYKKNLMDDRFKIDQFVSASFMNRARVDTVRGSYDWYGEFTPGSSIGESPRPSLSDIDFWNTMSRTNLTYTFNTRHKIESNFVFNGSNRKGHDRYGMRFKDTDIDILTKDAVYRKAIAGLMWESKWFDGRLTNQTTVKHFYFYTKGINGFLANATDLDDYTTYSQHTWGFSEAIKYQINSSSLLRGSVEFTNRLPRDFEIFGDNDTRAPNFDLKPEESININLAYRYDRERWSVEVASFYRKTEGLILLVPVQTPFAQYQNLDNVRGYGFDIDTRYELTPQLQLTGNLSWQDNRMADVEGLHKWIEGTRLRNTPYFFSNIGAYGTFNGLKSSDTFKPYFHWNFIREFYLNHIPRDQEPKGFLGLFGNAGVPITNIVPNQHLLSAGFTYHLSDQRVSISSEVKNVLNSKLFDYYKIQRPGRSIHLKLTYTLNH